MKYFITGGAGFIGSNLVKMLLEKEENTVVVYDNFSTGRSEFLYPIELSEKGSRLDIYNSRIEDTHTLADCMEGSDFVFHLAANADVRHGFKDPSKDVKQNILNTFNVLEAMRKVGVTRIAFSSSGAVYGEPSIYPTPESAPFPIQTSMYGASKLAGEAMLQAYFEGYGIIPYIFRFVSVLGKNYSHGHVYDFVKSLQNDPRKLKVLGDGSQTKSYMHVSDCIMGMLTGIFYDWYSSKVNIYNLGTDETCTVKDSIKWITEYMKVNPKIVYGSEKKGWKGDSPLISLNCKKIREAGWKPLLSIKEGVIDTVEYLLENLWLLEDK